MIHFLDEAEIEATRYTTMQYLANSSLVISVATSFL